MDNSVLIARLKALENNLNRVATSHVSLGKLSWEQWKGGPTQDRVMPQDLLNGLAATIGQEAKIARDEVERILELFHGSVSPQIVQKAWTDYVKIWRSSEGIFAECLEYLGGLALRDKTFGQNTGLELHICHLADELIRRCALDTAGDWHSLTIPAFQEPLSKTLARIIRLRFPEWTIWTLPITAHEYGHIMFEDKLDVLPRDRHGNRDGQQRSFYEVSQRLDSSRKRFIGMEQGRGANKKRAKLYYEEFLADAFACYTMGPAYACSLVLLRFNPVTAYDEDDQHPAEVRRAHIVFSMLREMDAKERDHPYQYVIGQLTNAWEGMLAGARAPDSLEQCDQHCLEVLEGLQGDFWSIFDKALIPAARYPCTPADTDEGSWTVAMRWSDQWWRDIRGSGYAKEIGQVSPTHTLRDVLNAAWRCRLLISDPTYADSIAQQARNLCDAILLAQDRVKSPAGSFMPPRTSA